MINKILGLLGNRESATGGAEAQSGLSLFTKIFIESGERDGLERYSPEVLARLAESAYAFLAQRPKAAHSIKIDRVTAVGQDGVSEDYCALSIANDDMPFLVDSIMAELHERELQISMVFHPVFKVERQDDGTFVTITGVGGRDWRDPCQESFFQVHFERPAALDQDDLIRSLSDVLTSVRQAVEDWHTMRSRVRQAIDSYSPPPPGVDPEILEESRAFLTWLVEDNFTFLGVREFTATGEGDDFNLSPDPTSGRGILQNPDVKVLRRGRELVHMTAEIRKFFQQPEPLIVTKANVVSRVHRRTHMDYVGIKIYGDDGRISGELRVVGLFTAAAYNLSLKRIPLLRRKADQVIAASGFPPDGHNGKALMNVLEGFPRDELFQIDVATLSQWSGEILDLDLRPRIRVFPRADEFDRFVSILVYVPRDRYTTEVRQRIGDYFAQSFNGVIRAFFPTFTRGPLVRIQFVVGRYEGATPKISAEELERGVEAIIRTWKDRLRERLAKHFPDSLLAGKLASYEQAFPAGYRDDFPPSRVLEDIKRIETLNDDNPVAVDFYTEPDMAQNRVHVALYRFDKPIPLSQRVPVFENMGFSVIDERSYKLKPVLDGEKRRVNLHDMVIETADGGPVDVARHQRNLEDCFLAYWAGLVESDTYNGLIKEVGIGWREAGIMRAYGAYLRQIGVAFGQRFLAETLIRHAGVTAGLIEMFKVRFDPDSGMSIEQRAQKCADIKAGLEKLLADIPSLSDDTSLRHFLSLIEATTRTNFYQREKDGNPPYATSFKINSRALDAIPEPKPFAEIFVYSPRVEGVHLRGGPIARGGLRWSDRPQDFRTEVLGLAKAQQVKNTVIVPAGSKGGFVPKMLNPAGTREETLSEGIASYKLFISNLLALTDNISGDGIHLPERVVRHDGDDPYLVVAADKGTATFSDYANEISQAHGFWLGDAFASGGSAGYDHKAMGITARGGWESVKRIFREMDVDVQSQPITAIGVGDMSGDVFGNGMLLSKHILLQAAFDHRDIFVDPDPDPAKSWPERKRLFEIGRSSWQDYDTALISRGGGVFSRAAKSITLTPEIRELTGLAVDKVTPNQLIRALLKIPADLLWFGGIGTYIRAGTESDAEVGDRANDALRITAKELRVKAVGEGANLGMTQRARIEFALAGGRINTDFIDNSSGVNSSDLEVNIKIAFRPALEAGKLTLEERNVVLEQMTEEVAAKCLRNNYLQTLAISLGEHRGVADLGFQQRLIKYLEARGLLNREIEYLPSDDEFAQRLAEQRALTRPELAVLLSYAKIALFDRLVESAVPDDSYLDGRLVGYFPRTLRERFGDEIARHRLRREIIATVLTNDVINRGGSTMIVRLQEETGRGAPDIVQAFIAAVAVYRLDEMWPRIDQLDNRISGLLQLELYREVQDLVRRGTAWFLRHASFDHGLEAVIDAYMAGVGEFRSAIETAMTERQAQQRDARSEEFVKAGVPSDLARDIASLDLLGDGCNVTATAKLTGRDVAQIARTYLETASYFRLGELRAASETLPISDYFDRLAINSTLSIIADAHRAVTADVVRGANGSEPDLKRWQAGNEANVKRARGSLDEILDGGALTVSRLTVAASQIRDLAPS